MLQRGNNSQTSHLPGQGSHCRPPRRCWTDLLDSEPRCRGSPRWLLLQKHKPYHSISTSNTNTLRCSKQWHRVRQKDFRGSGVCEITQLCLWPTGWHLSVGLAIQRVKNIELVDTAVCWAVKAIFMSLLIYLETVPESSTAQLDIKFLRVDMHGVSECLLHVDFSSHNRHLEIWRGLLSRTCLSFLKTPLIQEASWIQRGVSGC